jgi:AraC-like DNA-binding protein
VIFLLNCDIIGVVIYMDKSDFNNLAVEIEYFNHRICTPSWVIEEIIPSTPFVDVTYVTNGSADYYINNVHYVVKTGDLLCIQKGSHRRALPILGDLMECYAVNGRVFNLQAGETPMPLPLLTNIGVRQDIIDLYKQLNAAWLIREPCHVLKARSLYMSILQKYAKILYFNEETQYDKRITKAIHYIIEHFDEQLTVTKMAEEMGLNPLYFGNLFKKGTGMSFRQYLTSIRLNHADNMLHSLEYNVNEVAGACGFSDVFYFSKVFKENRGRSPSDIIYQQRKLREE